MERAEQIAKLKRLKLTECRDRQNRKKTVYQYGKSLYWFTVGVHMESYYVKAQCVEYGPDVREVTENVIAGKPVFSDEYFLEPGTFSQMLTNKQGESYSRNILDCMFFVDLMIKHWELFLSGEVIKMIEADDFSFLD